jgi:predicted nuclease of predicted toxin-antitoxin system
MRILADENVPGPGVRGLRDAGQHVLWARESAAGRSDRDLLSRAQAERRLLVTYDKDFGELAVAAGLPAAAGVILVRLTGASPAHDDARAVAAILGRDDWAGHFAVVADDRVRLRPLVRL